MAVGLFATRDGLVMVDYGNRKILISAAQYRANGYKPTLQRLKIESLIAQQAGRGSEAASGRSRGLPR